MIFNKIAILGAGLLGASFALAAKRNALCASISVWSRSESTRNKCLARSDIFSEVAETPSDAVKEYLLNKETDNDELKIRLINSITKG